MKKVMKRTVITVGAAFAALALVATGAIVWTELVHAGPGGLLQQGEVSFTRDYQREHEAELRERVGDMLYGLDTMPEAVSKDMLDTFISHPLTELRWDVQLHESYDALEHWDYPVIVISMSAQITGSMCEGMDARCEWWVVGYAPFVVYVSKYEPRLLGVKAQPDMAFILFDENTLAGYCPGYEDLSDSC